ncbi:hypothetical protein N7470_002268 [Penicillium chermesinum]|nr:hypothetical protein N7470_002268 [Penicillium chermesinum]
MDDILPTAKWANRMLRPLTSIYRRLEKHQETLTIINAESARRSRSRTPEGVAAVISQPIPAVESLSASGSDADEEDPVWIPGKKPDQRRVKHKYSARGRGKAGKRRTRLSIQSPETSRTLPGAIELATPVITGKRWELPPSAQSQRSASREPKALHNQRQQQVFRDRYSLHRSPWQELLDASGDPGFGDINFLNNTRIAKNTDDNPPKRNSGARSLLSMVMRRLPEFLAAEQEVQKEEEEIDEDMCDAYFTELELYYAPHGKGWRPLREAVRAQGMFLVTSMIKNGWLTDSIACALIENCKWNDHDACETLLSTFLSTRTSYPPPPSLRPSLDLHPLGDPMRALRKYSSHNSSPRSFIFKELSKLLQRGVLPPEWMATKLWNHWMTRATVSFSREDGDSATASRLIEAVLLRASRSLPLSTSPSMEANPQTPDQFTRALSVSSIERFDNARMCPVPVEDALSNHVISLLAALCGMHISRSRSSDYEEAKGTRAGHILGYLSFRVEENIEKQSPSAIADLTSHELFRRSCIILANCLVLCSDAILADNHEFALESAPGLEECSNIVASRPDLVKELALFMKQTFRCYSSASDSEQPNNTGSDIREMISMLPHVADGASVGLCRLWSRVAVDAAMEFAETTGEPEDHLWAMEIQETVNAIQDRTESNSACAGEAQPPCPRKGLFRWEESIGEWMPTAPRRAPYVPNSIDSSSTEPEHSDHSASSLTSSPSIGPGTKRDFQESECSPTRPAKRRREAPIIVVKRDEGSTSRPRSARAESKSPSLEPVLPSRRILRDLSNRKRSQPDSTIMKPSRIEVVIINQKRPADEKPIRSAREVVETEIHRTVERRRPGRPPVSRVATESRAPQRRSVIPCSEDDSEDELSFI